jgi:hypothetical protein
VSKKANALFWYSSWMTVYTGIFMAFMLTPWFRQTDASTMGKLVLQILVSPAALLGAPAVLIIIVGMAIHCLTNSAFSIGTKILWSVFVFCTAPFGAEIYFFTVYKKQTKIIHEASNG